MQSMCDSIRCIVDDTRDLHRYARVPISFEVKSCFEVSRDGGASTLRAVAVHPSYLKDYDAIPGCAPTDWPESLDINTVWLAIAFRGHEHIGGVALILDDSPRAMLWDMRVHPSARYQRVGSQLLAFAEAHARTCGKRVLQVETQNINVPACRFYEGAGFKLTSVDRDAYPTLPGEIALIWEKHLGEIA